MTSKYNEIIENFAVARDKEGQPLAMDSLIISTNKTKFSHDFVPNPSLVDLRSVSKPVLCLVLGIAIEKGFCIDGQKIDLDTKIWSIVSKRIHLKNTDNLPYLQNMTLRNLLNSNLGHEKGIMFRKDIGDRDESSLVNYVFEAPISHQPGTHFSYSNAGAFIVSVLMQWGMGITAAQAANELLLSKIGIVDVSWRNFDIYTCGCTGLTMKPEDLHKVGRLIADDGKYNGKQIVPKSWIREMKSERVPSPEKYDPSRAMPKKDYGFFLWKTPSGHAYCDGTNGIYLIILNDGKTVISTTGRQSDMKQITECLRPLL